MTGVSVGIIFPLTSRAFGNNIYLPVENELGECTFCPILLTPLFQVFLVAESFAASGPRGLFIALSVADVQDFPWLA